MIKPSDFRWKGGPKTKSTRRQVDKPCTIQKRLANLHSLDNQAPLHTQTLIFLCFLYLPQKKNTYSHIGEGTDSTTTTVPFLFCRSSTKIRSKPNQNTLCINIWRCHCDSNKKAMKDNTNLFTFMGNTSTPNRLDPSPSERRLDSPGLSSLSLGLPDYNNFRASPSWDLVLDLMVCLEQSYQWLSSSALSSNGLTCM